MDALTAQLEHLWIQFLIRPVYHGHGAVMYPFEHPLTWLWIGLGALAIFGVGVIVHQADAGWVTGLAAKILWRTLAALVGVAFAAWCFISALLALLKLPAGAWLSDDVYAGLLVSAAMLIGAGLWVIVGALAAWSAARYFIAAFALPERFESTPAVENR